MNTGLTILENGVYAGPDYCAGNQCIDQVSCPSETCIRRATANPRYDEKTVTSPTDSDINTMIENLKNSPIIIGIDGESSSFQNYSEGIVEGPMSSTINHAVVIVGYDSEEKTFKVRNSWGKSWGEEGYFRLKASPGIIGLGYQYIYNISFDFQE